MTSGFFAGNSPVLIKLNEFLSFVWYCWLMYAVTVTLLTSLSAISAMVLPRQVLHTLCLCSHLHLIVCKILNFFFLYCILFLSTQFLIFAKIIFIYTSALWYFCTSSKFSFIYDFGYQDPYSFTPVFQWYQTYLIYSSWKKSYSLGNTLAI